MTNWNFLFFPHDFETRWRCLLDIKRRKPICTTQAKKKKEKENNNDDEWKSLAGYRMYNHCVGRSGGCQVFRTFPLVVRDDVHSRHWNNKTGSFFSSDRLGGNRTLQEERRETWRALATLCLACTCKLATSLFSFFLSFFSVEITEPSLLFKTRRHILAQHTLF